MKDEKERGPGKDKAGKTPQRYLWHYCAACRKRLESLGYIISPSGRAPVWRSCGLCGKMELLEPVDMFKPLPRYRKQTGAGERARAGRRSR